MHQSSASYSLSPVELVVLQGTPFCNMNCTYCDLSEESRKTKTIMGRELIDRIFTELFTSGLAGEDIMVVWHSGEPLTLPISYYENAIAQIEGLRAKHAEKAVRVVYDIQTNGVRIDEDWCVFFKRHEHHLKIGISCDGPDSMHDSYRVNWGGRATHSKTLRGMRLLSEHGIKYKIIAVVTDKTLADPEAFYAFFNERRDDMSGFHFNILASAEGNDAALSYGAVDKQKYYDFYRSLLACSTASGPGEKLRIQNFSQGLSRILNTEGLDDHSYMDQCSRPLKALSVDARGFVTTFYAGLSINTLPDEYGDGIGFAIGNIMKTGLAAMAQSDKLQRITDDFAKSNDHCARNCEYAPVCSGGFEITQRTVNGSFASGETPECIIHVKALTDALLDDLDEWIEPAEQALAG